MGYSALIIDWIDYINEKCPDLLKGKSVVEFGHQDKAGRFSKKAVDRYILYAMTRLYLTKRESFFCKFDESKDIDSFGRWFFSLHGFDNHVSIDLLDKRSTYKIDLNAINDFGPLADSFDVLINIGTSEHIFNPGNSFVNAHNLTKVGGLMLHVLPSFGYFNHGFYTINPILFVELAKANNYEVIDIIFMDTDFTMMSDIHNFDDSYSFGSYDIFRRCISYSGNENLDKEHGDRIKMALNHISSVKSFFTEEQAIDARYLLRLVYMGGMTFSAFRKKSDASFVVPTQS